MVIKGGTNLEQENCGKNVVSSRIFQREEKEVGEGVTYLFFFLTKKGKKTLKPRKTIML